MESLEKLLEIFQPDPIWLNDTVVWYHKLFRREPQECLLLGIATAPFGQQKYDMKQQWESPEAMLYEHLRAMIASAQAKSAILPTLRANLGVAFAPSILGIEQQIFADNMPWPQGHLNKEEISKIDPSTIADRVAEKGLLPKAREIYSFYRAKLGADACYFIPDTQGVMDIAHILRGTELFMDMKDDPPFVHHLMEVSLQVYIAVTKAMKAAISEPMFSGMHGGIAMTNGGTRYCMDTTVLMRVADAEEFELPYLRRALAEFGGGWVHFCGAASDLLELLCQVPEARGLNSNYMDSRPYDYERDVKTVQKADKFFIGSPFKAADETLEDYFRRVLRPLAKPQDLVFTARGENLDISDPSAVISLWHKVQEKIFPR
jgi:hypothetical protein